MGARERDRKTVEDFLLSWVSFDACPKCFGVRLEADYGQHNMFEPTYFACRCLDCGWWGATSREVVVGEDVLNRELNPADRAAIRNLLLLVGEVLACPKCGRAGVHMGDENDPHSRHFLCSPPCDWRGKRARVIRITEEFLDGLLGDQENE